jgi:hypothetical protein
MRKSVCRQVVLAIGAALLYSVCGSGGSGVSPGNALDFQQLALNLPQAGSKAVNAGSILAHEGAGWDDYFPILRMETQWNPHGFGDSMSGVFMPVGTGSEEFAFAAYSFIINELDPPGQHITFKWGSALPNASRMWIGLSRPSGNSGHFEWY